MIDYFPALKFLVIICWPSLLFYSLLAFTLSSAAPIPATIRSGLALVYQIVGAVILLLTPLMGDFYIQEFLRGGLFCAFAIAFSFVRMRLARNYQMLSGWFFVALNVLFLIWYASGAPTHA